MNFEFIKTKNTKIYENIFQKYKDILNFSNIRKSDKLERLLQALALQIGKEVSYDELSGKLDMDKKTVEKYIQILEQSFIIFRSRPFGRNLRNELKKCWGKDNFF